MEKTAGVSNDFLIALDSILGSCTRVLCQFYNIFFLCDDLGWMILSHHVLILLRLLLKRIFQLNNFVLAIIAYFCDFRAAVLTHG